MGCCSVKWLPFNDISLSIWAVGLEVHLVSHQFLMRGRDETAFAALYTFMRSLPVWVKTKTFGKALNVTLKD